MYSGEAPSPCTIHHPHTREVTKYLYPQNPQWDQPRGLKSLAMWRRIHITTSPPLEHAQLDTETARRVRTRIPRKSSFWGSLYSFTRPAHVYWNVSARDQRICLGKCGYMFVRRFCSICCGLFRLNLKCPLKMQNSTLSLMERMRTNFLTMWLQWPILGRRRWSELSSGLWKYVRIRVRVRVRARARVRVMARIYGMAECMRARGRLQNNLDYRTWMHTCIKGTLTLIHRHLTPPPTPRPLSRFLQQLKIYTFVGDVVVSLNPYMRLPKMADTRDKQRPLSLRFQPGHQPRL